MSNVEKTGGMQNAEGHRLLLVGCLTSIQISAATQDDLQGG